MAKNLWFIIYKVNKWLAITGAIYYRYIGFHKNSSLWKFQVKIHKPFVAIHSYLCRYDGYKKAVNQHIAGSASSPGEQKTSEKRQGANDVLHN